MRGDVKAPKGEESLPRPCVIVIWCKQGGRSSSSAMSHLKAIKWCLMANKPHHHQQALAHDVIINSPASRVRKASVQNSSGMIMHHLSEWCPSIIKYNILHRMLNKVWVHCPRCGLSAHLLASMTIFVK
jgi:hypothetical protein